MCMNYEVYQEKKNHQKNFIQLKAKHSFAKT